MSKSGKSNAARTGKIAALPAVLREDLNRRMLNGELSPTLLPWLNGLPGVKAMLAERFDNQMITASNLSDWRRGGFKDWLKTNERTEQIKMLSGYAAELAQANGGRLAEGAQAIAGGRILEILENSVGSLDVATIGDLTVCLTNLRKTEIAQQRADQGKVKLGQNEKQLTLEREKFEAQFFQKLLKGALLQKAAEIAGSDLDNEAKIAALRQAYFADVDTLEKSGEIQIPE